MSFNTYKVSIKRQFSSGRIDSFKSHKSPVITILFVTITSSNGETTLFNVLPSIKNPALSAPVDAQFHLFHPTIARLRAAANLDFLVNIMLLDHQA